MKNRIKGILMAIVMIFTTFASFTPAYALELPTMENQAEIIVPTAYYSFNEDVGPGETIVRDYWVGSNQSFIFVANVPGPLGDFDDITSTVTNLTTGDLVAWDQCHVGLGIAYSLTGQNAYFRVEVTNNTAETVNMNGGAEITSL